ncbi:MAG: hypothetical protein NTW56_11500 [Alphaproteobacteria bacterium]|nr:hypothetical protein [Alphaproteobacteria bacterium]
MNGRTQAAMGSIGRRFFVCFLPAGFRLTTPFSRSHSNRVICNAASGRAPVANITAMKARTWSGMSVSQSRALDGPCAIAGRLHGIPGGLLPAYAELSHRRTLRDVL